MEIKELLARSRVIWGGPEYAPDRIAVALGVVTGDIHRQVRSLQEDGSWDVREVGKELGNLVFSAIRWCDDLGLDPEECIRLAEGAQRSYAKRLLSSREDSVTREESYPETLYAPQTAPEPSGGVTVPEVTPEAVSVPLRTGDECYHCARPLASPSYGVVNGEKVCHTGTLPPDRDPLDCYRLVTVYGEELGARICNCCTFGNHNTGCTCDGRSCCHPTAYLDYNPAWGHGTGGKR